MSEDVVPYGGLKPDEAARTDELRALMKELGLSQRETADELEVDQRTVRYWAASNPAPPRMAIYALRYLVTQRSASGVLTPEAIAEANARGGHKAVDELARKHVQDVDDDLEQGSKGNR